mmetsp:Transcript_52863/g.142511  ORF Transcript_52863/g.142511 Transcript_52863/m.142511 type:complete len:273 (-) Transcript_52863:489-1307(-)
MDAVQRPARRAQCARLLWGLLQFLQRRLQQRLWCGSPLAAATGPRRAQTTTRHRCQGRPLRPLQRLSADVTSLGPKAASPRRPAGRLLGGRMAALMGWTRRQPPMKRHIGPRPGLCQCQWKQSAQPQCRRSRFARHRWRRPRHRWPSAGCRCQLRQSARPQCRRRQPTRCRQRWSCRWRPSARCQCRRCASRTIQQCRRSATAECFPRAFRTARSAAARASASCACLWRARRHWPRPTAARRSGARGLSAARAARVAPPPRRGRGCWTRWQR